MPPAAGVVAQRDRIPVNPMIVPTSVQRTKTLPPGVVMTTVSETFAKDAIISWFRGEFAAANAIIDALCSHLTELDSGGVAEYESAFAAIHRRRLNWIPILHKQKYFSIADIPPELKKVADEKIEKSNGVCEEPCSEKAKNLESSVEESEESNDNEVGEEDFEGDDSPKSEITDAGSQEVIPSLEHDICFNHEECAARRAQIKMTKGFVAKEPLKGHMVNVVRGLKLYEDIFTDTELSKLNDFVNELRVAGQNGELSDETYIIYNQQVKGNKREMIQLGVPIFGHIENNSTDKSYNEPIPALLQGVIEHLVQWHLIPEHRKPNSCIINFFDEGEHSQPFLKPPHLDQPLSTLLLSESTMAFGRVLVNDNEGNYKGPLVLSLKKGSFLVMRGNSSDTASHAMCTSLNKRISITFFRVRTETESNAPAATTPLNKTMTLWKHGVSATQIMPNGYAPLNMVPKWSLLHAPVVMLTPVHPMVANPKRIPGSGTGVFLPWTVAGSRKPTKHLPPRAQRGRFLSLPSSAETRKAHTTSDSGFNDSIVTVM